MTRLIDKIKSDIFLRNFSILTVGEFLSKIFIMSTNIIVARMLSPIFYGKYSLFITYVMIFFTMSSLGLPKVIIKSVARNQKSSKFIFNISSILRLIGFVLAILLFFLFVAFYDKEEWNTFFIISLIIGIFLESAWEELQNISFGMQRMEWNSLINIVSSSLTLLTYLLIPAAYFTLNNVIIVFLLFYLLRVLAFFFIICKKGLLTEDKLSSPTITVRAMFEDSMPFYLLAIFSLFSNQLPIIFLKMNSTIEEIAFFNTANKLLIPMTLVAGTAMTAIFPNLSKVYVENKQAFYRQTQKVFLFISTFCSIAAVCVSLFRKEIVLLLYGNAYLKASDVMGYQCWYLVLFVIFCFIGSLFAAADRHKLMVWTSIVYALVNVPILYIAAKYGATGLSIGFIIAGVLNMTYHYHYVREVIDYQISHRLLISIFSFIIICFFFSMSISNDFSLISRILILLLISLLAFINKNRLSIRFKKM